MRWFGGARIVLLAVVASTALTACVSAPAADRPVLRVLPGGAGLPPSPAPSITARPEPPIGVIMSGRLVIDCAGEFACAFVARLRQVRSETHDAAPAGRSTTVSIDAVPRGFGPTARTGHPAMQDPSGGTVLVPGVWHVQAWTPLPGTEPGELGHAGAGASCGLDFHLRPGQALTLEVHRGASGCSLRLGGSGVD